MRAESAYTTTELRTKDFTIIVAPALDGTASGSLYLDEGNNLDQPNTSEITFLYANGTFTMGGKFGYNAGNVSISSVVLLGSEGTARVNSTSVSMDSRHGVKTASRNIPLTKCYTARLA